jgi:hypothetical protein
MMSQKIILNAVTMLLFFSSMPAMAINPAPDLQINGMDSAVTITSGDNLQVTVNIEPGDYVGHWLDTWVSATMPQATYWYVKGQGWIESYHPMPALSEPLYLIQQASILTRSDLPAGHYTFRLAVDDNNDGVMDATFSDSIDVSIEDSQFVEFRVCRSCHEHPEAFPVRDISIPDRHHLLVQYTELECTDCHDVKTDVNGAHRVVKITECRTCHEHPETFPVRDISIPDRHHQMALPGGFECLECHSFTPDP